MLAYPDSKKIMFSETLNKCYVVMLDIKQSKSVSKVLTPMHDFINMCESSYIYYNILFRLNCSSTSKQIKSVHVNAASVNKWEIVKSERNMQTSAFTHYLITIAIKTEFISASMLVNINIIHKPRMREHQQKGLLTTTQPSS